MKRITGKYGELKLATQTIEKIDGIDYRVTPVDGAIIMAFDHESGVVIDTGFYEVDDFRPYIFMKKLHASEYHEMVVAEVEKAKRVDRKLHENWNSYCELSHP